MISANLDSEGSPLDIPLTADNLHKWLAKATIQDMGIARHVSLTKRARLEGGIAGFDEGHKVLGYFTDEPEVGKPFYLARYNTVGREQFGWFTTTPVAEITLIEGGLSFTTMNSVYTLEYTPDPLTI